MQATTFNKCMYELACLYADNNRQNLVTIVCPIIRKGLATPLGASLHQLCMTECNYA